MLSDIKYNFLVQTCTEYKICYDFIKSQGYKYKPEIIAEMQRVLDELNFSKPLEENIYKTLKSNLNKVTKNTSNKITNYFL